MTDVIWKGKEYTLQKTPDGKVYFFPKKKLASFENRVEENFGLPMVEADRAILFHEDFDKYELKQE